MSEATTKRKPRTVPTTSAVAHGDDLLTTKQVELEYGISAASLHTWRLRGGGPRFVSPRPRFIRYRRSAIIEWIGNELHSSAEAAHRNATT